MTMTKNMSISWKQIGSKGGKLGVPLDKPFVFIAIILDIPRRNWGKYLVECPGKMYPIWKTIAGESVRIFQKSFQNYSRCLLISSFSRGKPESEFLTITGVEKC